VIAGLLAFGSLTASLALVAPLRTAIGSAVMSVVPLLVLIAIAAGAAYAITLVSAQTALLDRRGSVGGVDQAVVDLHDIVRAGKARHRPSSMRRSRAVPAS